MKLRTFVLLIPPPYLPEELVSNFLRADFFKFAYKVGTGFGVEQVYKDNQGDNYIEFLKEGSVEGIRQEALAMRRQFDEVVKASQQAGDLLLGNLFHFHAGQVGREIIHVAAFGAEPPDISLYSPKSFSILGK